MKCNEMRTISDGGTTTPMKNRPFIFKMAKKIPAYKIGRSPTPLRLTINLMMFWKAKLVVGLKQPCLSFQILGLMLRPAVFSLWSGLSGKTGSTI